ncbi:MAG: hypothetical protein COU63_00360 [Candidatus Pacebacteria bacterium CG10_big_fil_rev_8_21_14_0_10_36_11]|nr:M48 family metallopeptidase [Candidatus Pacearchaeota archaeon]OIP74208.1 MAG: hypothetical protein AUK08_03110 [Candidatus Pacebacteria bacterium CG2_30_36_39]PIR65111.1 MAG: hypothetical protein COU63_00360 [Candidatus Pacebacteria bacterium CG10_big_fil_rev_8_21_14_0_10_36_11]PJC42666.1 MAG: hypothetical protein CO040_03250 [Candidatus Pacebacteria bacterium CG_4_9_14_0_2_um_filter_36_8]
MEYTIKVNPKSRRITLRIGKDGIPLVTVPPLVPKFFIKRFVEQQQAWINKARQQKLSQQNQFFAENSISLFGKKYLLDKINTLKASQVNLQNDRLIIAFHQNNIDAKIPIFNPIDPPAFFVRFLKNTAQHYLLKRTAELAKVMNTKYNDIHFRAQKTRWGSCSSQKNLNFNWRLVHFEPKIIDYVIIHELAHLTHMNHSNKFWELVEKYDPEYRLNRGWLKRQGGQLE